VQVLIYTTLNHIKYCLPNGDNGIIRTLEQPVYVTRVQGGVIYALDREGKTRQIQVGAAPGAAAGAAAGLWRGCRAAGLRGLGGAVVGLWGCGAVVGCGGWGCW
jgi:hypothetical protein